MDVDEWSTGETAGMALTRPQEFTHGSCAWPPFAGDLDAAQEHLNRCALHDPSREGGLRRFAELVFIANSRAAIHVDQHEVGVGADCDASLTGQTENARRLGGAGAYKVGQRYPAFADQP